MYNKYKVIRSKRLNTKIYKTKRYITKKYKTKRYRKNKKGGIYGVRPTPSGPIHEGAEIPHYHFQVLLPSGKSIDLGTAFGITHFLEGKNQNFYSDYVANLLQIIEEIGHPKENVTLFWKGKMLLPNMKLRRINVDGHFIDLNDLASDMILTSKYTSQLTREDFTNIANVYVPLDDSIEYRDKPDTPREQKGERVSIFDEELIAKFNEKIEERKRQLGMQ